MMHPTPSLLRPSLLRPSLLLSRVLLSTVLLSTGALLISVFAPSRSVAGTPLAATPAAAAPAAETAATESPAPTRPPDRVIRLVAERFTFVPSRIKLKLGEVVELRIRSLDTDHGFRLQDTDVNVVIPKRGRGEVRVLFRAQRKGVFHFVCSKACGAGHTIMRGRIIVK